MLVVVEALNAVKKGFPEGLWRVSGERSGELVRSRLHQALVALDIINLGHK